MRELRTWKRLGLMPRLEVRQASVALGLLVGFGIATLGAARAAEDLSRLRISLAATSVSGLSSGAYMAGQMEVAHSKDIIGAGVVAGGPFACAETESSPVVEADKRFYAAVGVPEGNITLVEKEGGHAFLTETEGTACGLSKDPYVSACGYDQAKAILEWIYGSPLAGPSPSPTGKFTTFDQVSFSKGRPNGLAAEGVVYVPSECASHPGCRLHIALHGCDQARETVGDAFIKESGFARYADTNRLVILFPQIAGSTVNPYGCWDWWGYTDIDYLSKHAPQIQAIWDMAERLAM
jgi:hypothetical protein